MKECSNTKQALIYNSFPNWFIDNKIHKAPEKTQKGKIGSDNHNIRIIYLVLL